jgi:hypothetical protein
MASPRKQTANEYEKEEAQRRFEAALRGGLSTPPKPLKRMTPKCSKAQRDSDPMPENDPATLSRCEEIFCQWADEPENRLSLEIGSYGGVELLVQRLAHQIQKAPTSRHG